MTYPDICVVVTNGESVGAHHGKVTVNGLLHCINRSKNSYQGHNPDGNNDDSKNGTQQLSLNGRESDTNVYFKKSGLHTGFCSLQR